jgi:hypothetical protein
MGNAAIKFQQRQGHAAESPLAMHQDALVIALIAKTVGFYFMFLVLGIRHAVFAGMRPPVAFHNPLHAEKISRLNGVCFIGAAENHPVVQIQREHCGFVFAERRDERRGGLSGGINGQVGDAAVAGQIVIVRRLSA